MFHFLRSGSSPKKSDAGELLKKDFVVFDFETTGFSASRGDKVISVGGIKVIDGKINRSNGFYSLVDPQREIPEVVTKLTGIQKSHVEGKKTFEEVMPLFMEWANDKTQNPLIAGHAIDFDVTFLGQFKQRDPMFKKYLDTRTLIGMVYPGLGNKSLFHISEYLEFKILKEHNALEDAILSAHVLIAALTELKAQNITTLDSLERMIKSKNLILPSQY
nr:3'-5' exonuclease [Alkalibacter mobilis]